MINARVRAQWDRLMSPAGRAVARSGISPDAITYVGVLIQAGAAVLILDGRLLVAGLVMIGAALADVFDGAVAKARGLTSKFGAFLDSTTDRLSDALVFLPIAWLYGVSPDVVERSEPWVAAVALAALVFSFLVSYAKARAESLGFDCNVGIAERAERLILVIVALVFDVVPYVMAALAVLAAATFLQRMWHVHVQAKSAA